MSNFTFDVVDKYKPEYVIEQALIDFNKETRGYVIVEIKPYSGYISSYIVRTGFSFNISKAFEPREEEVDIQNDLGVVESEDQTFQVCVRVKGLDNYLYRLMFIKHSDISYPVTVVLSEDIASNCFDSPKQETLELTSMQEITDLMNNILSADYFHKLIQQLINEALRQEASTTNPPQTIGKLG